ncbi:MAG: ABC transporter permease [Azospirillaceae bacterium]
MTDTPPLPRAAAAPEPSVHATPGRLARLRQSDFVYELERSPGALIAALVTLAFFILCFGAPLFAPHTPFDPATVSLRDSLLPPAWIEGGRWEFPLGTDDQGRDILSMLLYGGRISLFVGFAAIGLGAAFGIAVGLAAGWLGGLFDSLAMRLADIQLSMPDVMLALFISGIARAALPREAHADIAVWILVFAIAAANWPQYARVVRAATLAARDLEYVQAARVSGVPVLSLLVGHVLPGALRPVLVIATVGLAFAILSEAALSFVGVGMPPTQPTLGALIRIGNSYLFSGEWWVSLSPAFGLLALVLSVNVFGDWLRDRLGPSAR